MDKVSEEQMKWTIERLEAWEHDFQELMHKQVSTSPPDVDWNARAFAAGSVRANVVKMMYEIMEKRG